ncbi:G-patch domain [Sesbania bispinosa]|nr:G-patch domain [Sesbania bispinosa]
MGVDDEDADFSITDYINKKSMSGDRGMGKKNAKRNDFRLQELQSSQTKSSKYSASRGSSKGDKKGSGQKGSYANQPVSFVSSGTIHSETIQVTAVDSEETDITYKKGVTVTSSANLGSFEVHTTGFGSKMMAKMGYMGGGGLGKDGQGMAEPIEVIQRPKSLGLGVQFSSNPAEPATEPARSRSSRSKSSSSSIGAFEKHTKGFGSKMMAKMGFVEGAGLGRESQVITAPLSAVRLPKSRGLGAKG